MLNARLIKYFICLGVAYLFRDLLRFLLALEGSLELRLSVSAGDFFVIWPAYVDLIQILSIPVDAIVLVYLWRMVEWK